MSVQLINCNKCATFGEDAEDGRGAMWEFLVPSSQRWGDPRTALKTCLLLKNDIDGENISVICISYKGFASTKHGELLQLYHKQLNPKVEKRSE